MASSKIAWGMEIGANAIKAIRLEREGDSVNVTDFAVIPHKKILTTPDVDQDELIRLSLGEFISQKSIENERLLVSVPGHAAFARFAKLPPVEKRTIPDIVKFEAVQQIPFPIEEVEWDYQAFASADSPEVEVGIFAITRERLQQRLSLYGELGVQPEVVTLSPVAAYNAIAYDLQLGPGSKPVVMLDIGTTASDLIVADEGRCWIRSFPLGGSHFTDAVMSAFKLSYSKADKLKQEAATSKYAKQIMQAMRPVFSDLLQEIQRSLGYYQSLHREAALETMIGFGSTFKIPGLRKFLGQQLQMEVHRLDEFRRIRVEGREAADFAAHAVNFATAYGLALQGVGEAAIAVNLAPIDSLREQVWRSKTKWFAAAAGVIIAAGGLMFLRSIVDGGSMRPGGVAPVVDQVLQRSRTLREQAKQLESQSNVGFVAENMRRLADDRTVWPYVVQDVVDALRSAEPQPALVADNLASIVAIPANERRLIRLTGLDGQYNGFANNARRINVAMRVEFTHADKQGFLNETVARWLRDNAEREGVPYRILTETISLNTPQLTTAVVGPGNTLVAGGTSTGSTPPPRIPSGSGTVPRGGSQAGGTTGTTGGSTGGLGGGFNNRRTTGERITAPGSEGLSGGGGGGGGQVTPPVERGDQGERDGGGSTFASGGAAGRPTEPRKTDLDVLAPIAPRPSMYKEGDQVHSALVTFTIELTGSTAQAAGAGSGTDDADAEAEEESA